MASQLPAHFVFATLVPWSSPQRPSKLATLLDSAPGGHRDAQGIESLASECGSLLVPCTFETRYEKRMMKKLLKQLEPFSDFCAFVLQLREVPGEMSREYVQKVMAPHDALLLSVPTLWCWIPVTLRIGCCRLSTKTRLGSKRMRGVQRR
ncbi:unnamed protein product [Prorocentrum cordatum]|uniref:Uncharacterized protein n=1 Tax=Prorocentrum cordatum TaxID=2364126 RepID=A0ABN9W9I7_9DINO|nr:unnamed protein product [Polarella glacialis]